MPSFIVLLFLIIQPILLYLSRVRVCPILCYGLDDYDILFCLVFLLHIFLIIPSILLHYFRVIVCPISCYGLGDDDIISSLFLLLYSPLNNQSLLRGYYVLVCSISRFGLGDIHVILICLIFDIISQFLLIYLHFSQFATLGTLVHSPSDTPPFCIS